MKKMHFPAISRPKFQRFPLQCLPWDHQTKPINQAFSKETESLGNTDADKSALKNSCPPVFLGNRHTEGTKKTCGKKLLAKKPKCFHFWSIYIQTR